MTAPAEPHRAAGAAPAAGPPISRERWRQRTLPALRGDVVDIGAGAGRAVPLLTGCTTVTCVEPRRGAFRRLVRTAQGHPAVTPVRAAAERLPLRDSSIDTAICSTVLCSVRDPDRALTEAHRVLRPGGRLVFYEHVAAPPGSWTRRAQRGYAPLSRLFDGGCDPVRDIGAALGRSDLQVVELFTFDERGPLGTRIPILYGAAVRRGVTRSPAPDPWPATADDAGAPSAR